VLAALAAVFVTSCATFEKAFWCRAKVSADELRLNGSEPRWELGEPARAQGFSLDRDYGIWFKSFDPAKDFDCKPDASMSSCKPKERPSGKRYYHGVQLRGPQVVPLLDPWVGN